MCLQGHRKFLMDVPVCGWDVAVTDTEGPVLLEANLWRSSALRPLMNGEVAALSTSLFSLEIERASFHPSLQFYPHPTTTPLQHSQHCGFCMQRKMSSQHSPQDSSRALMKESRRLPGDMTPDIRGIQRVGCVLYLVGWAAWVGVFTMLGGWAPQNGAVWPHMLAWGSLLVVFFAALFFPMPAPLGAGALPFPFPDVLVAAHHELFGFIFIVVYISLRAQGKWDSWWCLSFFAMCVIFSILKHILYRSAATRLLADAYEASTALGSELSHRAASSFAVKAPFGAMLPFISITAYRIALSPERTDVMVPSTLVSSCCGSSDKFEVSVFVEKGGSEEASRPVLFYVHGGAWVGGSHKRNASLAFIHRLVKEGWVVVSCSYRKKKWPIHLVDCAEGLRWAVDHAVEYGGNTAQGIHICGASAGGHIAAMLVALTTVQNVSAVPAELLPLYQKLNNIVPLSLLGWYPAMDPKDDCKRGARFPCGVQIYEWFFDKLVGMEGDWETVQPCWLMRAGRCKFPPVLIMHGVTDSVVPIGHAEHFYEHVKEMRDNDLDAMLPIWYTRHTFEVLPGAHTTRCNEVSTAWLAVVHRKIIGKGAANEPIGEASSAPME